MAATATDPVADLTEAPFDATRKKLSAIGPDFRANADAFFTLGKYSSAIIEYRNALRDNPTDVAVLTRLGMSLVRSKKYHEADEILLKATRLAPEDTAANTEYARLLLALGQVEKAINYARRATRARALLEQASLSSEATTE
jgi:tetratricopeptide (TPR) repeat protein